MKRLLLALALMTPAFADLPLETPITRGETTISLRLLSPDFTAPLDAPKYLTVIYLAHSPRTALARVTVRYSCDGRVTDSRLSWYGFGFPGPEAQSVELYSCAGEVRILSVKITEFAALSVNIF